MLQPLAQLNLQVTDSRQNTLAVARQLLRDTGVDGDYRTVAELGAGCAFNQAHQAPWKASPWMMLPSTAFCS